MIPPKELYGPRLDDMLKCANSLEKLTSYQCDIDDPEIRELTVDYVRIKPLTKLNIRIYVYVYNTFSSADTVLPKPLHVAHIEALRSQLSTNAIVVDLSMNILSMARFALDTAMTRMKEIRGKLVLTPSSTFLSTGEMIVQKPSMMEKEIKWS